MLCCVQMSVLLSTSRYTRTILCSEVSPSFKRFVYCVVFRCQSFFQLLGIHVLYYVQMSVLLSTSRYTRTILCSEVSPSFKRCVVFRGQPFVQTPRMLHCDQMSDFRYDISPTHVSYCIVFRHFQRGFPRN